MKMASMRASESVWMLVTWVLTVPHSPAASNADFCAIRSLTSDAPRVCKAFTGVVKPIASTRVRLPLPVTLVVPLSMVDSRAVTSLLMVDMSPVKALTAVSSVEIPDPTASKILVIVATSRSTSVGSRLTRTGSAATPRAKVMNGSVVVNLMLALYRLGIVRMVGKTELSNLSE